MSGLVPGLQNQLERFDSASDLQQMQLISQKISCFFYSSPTPKTKEMIYKLSRRRCDEIPLGI